MRRRPRVPKVKVLVATDDARIHESVRRFGGWSTMVTEPCRTGTDRVAAAVRELSCEIVVNLQADEIPFSPDLLLDLIDPFLASDAQMGTLRRPLLGGEEFTCPSVVKVVTDRQGRALYFSRAPIPHVRDSVREDGSPFAALHVGVYIFRRQTLNRFAALASGELEQAERLEQLRALEHGIPIQVWDTAHASLRIDTREDLERAEASWDELRAGRVPGDSESQKTGRGFHEGTG